MKKHLRIALIAALAVVACLLITVIAVISGGGLSGGNKNCRYPYSWKLKLDGSVDFSVKATSVEGFSWIAEPQPNLSGIIVSQLDDSFGNSKFNILPFSSGANTMELRCVNDKQQIEMSLSVTFTTLENGILKNVSVIETDYNLDTNGKAEGCEYSVYASEEGGLEVRFKYADGVSYTWREPDEGNKGVWVYYPFEGSNDLLRVALFDEMKIVTQRPTQPEDGQPAEPEPSTQSAPLPEASPPPTLTAQLYGEDNNKKQDLILTIEFEYSERKVEKIISHTVQATAHKTPEDYLEQDRQEAEQHVGKKINAIENASSWEYNVYGTELEKNQTSFASFSLEEKVYRLAISKDKSLGKPDEGIKQSIKEVEGDKAVKPPYSVYTSTNEKIIYWKTADGLSCTLSADISVSTEKLIELADKLLG